MPRANDTSPSRKLKKLEQQHSCQPYKNVRYCRFCGHSMERSIADPAVWDCCSLDCLMKMDRGKTFTWGYCTFCGEKL